ncbi:ATP-binding protein [Xanthobacteraceae bacterium Astr-EGSB]|uniref:ATP-binding protein n=1 Tax=Astrobacterium formosum TaxID=3069710 RepID=UPI0027B29144|nr:ATP-binding protein [Xanthobacteraceae bacterium Astr-EGSB]
MKRLLPDSLIGRLMLVLMAGLIVSHGVGWWIYAIDREAAVREVGGFAVAQRIANLARLVDEAPADWRERIVVATSDAGFRLSLASQPPGFSQSADAGPVAAAIQAYLTERVSAGGDGRSVSASARTIERASERGHGHGMGWGRTMNMLGMGPAQGYGRGRFAAMGEALVALDVAVPLSGGQWLLASTALPEASPVYSRQFVVSMAVMALVIILASIWAARRVTAPLADLASAAQRLGRDVHAPPIPETGTRETRQASRAFNDMQTRLRELIDNRTRLLAAISHDLRTPLTLLRLRTENVAEADERDRMLATLAEMEALIATTLQYARDEIASEPERAIDVAALLASLADDMSDAGLDVTLTPAPATAIRCRPTALKRALRNLLDNAVKYGTRARVALRDIGPEAEITIDDDGPGLAPEEIARVFEPFYRVEGSRSRDTGGIGLGLAITRSLIERQGGSVTLANRTGGGLRASVRLPKAL